MGYGRKELDADEIWFRFIAILIFVVCLAAYAYYDNGKWRIYVHQNNCRILERDVPIATTGYDGRGTTRYHDKWFCEKTQEVVWR